MSKKLKILGRRIRGDIGPTGLEPRTQQAGRDFSGAVSLTGVDQFYDQTSVTQNFTIGSRMVVDERSYYYSQAVAGLVFPCTYRLAVSTDQILVNNDRLSVAPAALSTGTQVTVDVALGFAPAFAAFQGGVVALNELVGGWLEIWPVAGGSFVWRRITANTAAVGGNITLTVDRPFDVAIGIGSGVTIHPNQYRRVNSAGAAGLAGFAAAIGVPPVPVAINRYFWLQTYGPCLIGPTGAWPLSVANFYDVYYHSAGETNSFNNEGGAGGGNISIQRIGHVYGSGAYGSGGVFLEIAR